MKKIIKISLFVLSLLFISGCSEPVGSNKLQVVTTIFPIYDMVRSVGDDLVDVSLMVAPGQDIHSYDPSTSDIIEAKKCDILIYIGDYMETWIPDISSSTEDDQLVVELSSDERIELESLEHYEYHNHDHKHNHNADMHIWTNPRYAIIMVEQISNSLIMLDPNNENKYREKANAYINELQNIIGEITNIVTNAKRNTLYFGSPFAFYYFTREFKLEHLSIYDTCSIEVEPTIDKIIEMNTKLKDNNVPVLYTKELLNDSIARKVIEGSNAEICLLHSGHNVSIDDFNQGITFLEIWRNNIEALKRGLL